MELRPRWAGNPASGCQSCPVGVFLTTVPVTQASPQGPEHLSLMGWWQCTVAFFPGIPHRAGAGARIYARWSNGIGDLGQTRLHPVLCLPPGTSGADWIGCWGSAGTPFSLYRHLCHSLLLGITQNPQKFTSEKMLPDTHSKQDTVPVTNPMDGLENLLLKKAKHTQNKKGYSTESTCHGIHMP